MDIPKVASILLFIAGFGYYLMPLFVRGMKEDPNGFMKMMVGSMWFFVAAIATKVVLG
jgi:hypothetical protein